MTWLWTLLNTTIITDFKHFCPKRHKMNMKTALKTFVWFSSHYSTTVAAVPNSPPCQSSPALISASSEIRRDFGRAQKWEVNRLWFGHMVKLCFIISIFFYSYELLLGVPEAGSRVFQQTYRHTKCAFFATCHFALQWRASIAFWAGNTQNHHLPINMVHKLHLYSAFQATLRYRKALYKCIHPFTHSYPITIRQ